MRTFTEKYPADEYPGIIDGQPDGVVQRFDEIAVEVNALHESGQLTMQKVLEVAEEMRTLCYQ